MEAIILSGIQGAGKSTFCRDHWWDSHVRISYDMLRTRHREALLLHACIAGGQPFVGVAFHVPIGLAIERNAGREGKARIPDKAIRATRNKFEPLTFDEGFAEILDVFVTTDGLEILERQHAI